LALQQAQRALGGARRRVDAAERAEACSSSWATASSATRAAWMRAIGIASSVSVARSAS
jgi:hypothetical protein